VTPDVLVTGGLFQKGKGKCNRSNGKGQRRIMKVSIIAEPEKNKK
jgi:hypothetical protein